MNGGEEWRNERHCARRPVVAPHTRRADAEQGRQDAEEGQQVPGDASHEVRHHTRLCGYLWGPRPRRDGRRAEILQGDSTDVLPEVVEKMDEPTLFWLDGHYSGGITASGEQETPIVTGCAQFLTIVSEATWSSLTTRDSSTGRRATPLWLTSRTSCGARILMCATR